MMQDVHVKLNPGFLLQNVAINKKKTRLQEIGLKFEEETNKVRHMEHRLVWC